MKTLVGPRANITSLNPMNDGWIKLHRSALHHPVLRSARAMGFWTYLLLQANWAPRKRMVDGEIRVIDRGEILTSLAKMADDTKLTIKQVRHLLDVFEMDNMVARKGARKGTHLTICNYESYQGIGHDEGTIEGTKGARKGQHYKKERREEEDNTPLTPLKGGDVAKPRRRDQRWHEYRWYLEQRQKGVDNDRMEMRVVDGKAQYRMKS